MSGSSTNASCQAMTSHSADHLIYIDLFDDLLRSVRTQDHIVPVALHMLRAELHPQHGRETYIVLPQRRFVGLAEHEVPCELHAIAVRRPQWLPWCTEIVIQCAINHAQHALVELPH